MVLKVAGTEEEEEEEVEEKGRTYVEDEEEEDEEEVGREEEEEEEEEEEGDETDAVLMAIPSSKQSNSLSTRLIGPSNGRNWNSFLVKAKSSEGRRGLSVRLLTSRTRDSRRLYSTYGCIPSICKSSAFPLPPTPTPDSALPPLTRPPTPSPTPFIPPSLTPLTCVKEWFKAAYVTAYASCMSDLHLSGRMVINCIKSGEIAANFRWMRDPSLSRSVFLFSLA